MAKFCLFLFLFYQFLIGIILANIHDAASGEDVKVLMNIARDYRYGGNKIPINLSRSVHYYQHALEKPSDDPKLLSTLLFELHELLEHNPTLLSDYSPWDLLVGAAELGHEMAQYRLSVVYGFGIYSNGLVPMDNTKSLLLSHMSALSGNPLAHLNMGYRYLYGIGVNPSCDKALPYYEYAAIHAIEEISSHDGVIPVIEKYKLADLTDATSTTIAATYAKQEVSSEVVQYYESLAESGDAVACAMLGTMYTTGNRLVPVDEEKALFYFFQAVKMQYTAAFGSFGYLAVKHIQKRRETPQETDTATASRDTLRIEGSKAKVPYAEVMQCLQQAGKQQDVQAYLALGFAAEHGLFPTIMPTNLTKAAEYYSKVLHAHPDAGYYLGNLFVRQYVEYEVLLVEFGSLSQAKAFGIIADYPALFPSIAQSIDREIARTARGMTGGKPGVRKEGRDENPVSPQLILQSYSFSAQLGNILAQFAATQITHHGLSSLVADMQAKLNEQLLQHSKVFGAAPGADKPSAATRTSAASSLHTIQPPQHAQHMSADLLQQFLPAVLPGGAQAMQGNMLVAPVRTCEQLVQGYKLVAERNVAQQEHFIKAWTAFQSKQYSVALGHYSVLASLGYEIAQSNLAFLLSQPAYCPAIAPTTNTNNQLKDSRYKPLPSHIHRVFYSHEEVQEGVDQGNRIAYLSDNQWSALVNNHTECEVRAYNAFALSSLQGNADSLLQLGDYYYYGKANLTAHAGKTLQYYTKAADLHHIQALFNLALMYQFGRGVDQDFHLAKRYYDLAAELDPLKARLPRDVMLFFLYQHQTLRHYLHLVQAAARGEDIASLCPALTSLQSQLLAGNVTSAVLGLVGYVQFQVTFQMVKIGHQVYQQYGQDWSQWMDYVIAQAQQCDAWLQSVCATLEEHYSTILTNTEQQSPPVVATIPVHRRESSGQEASLKHAANSYYMTFLAPYLDDLLRAIQSLCQTFKVTSEEFKELMVCSVLLICLLLYKTFWTVPRQQQ